MNMILLKHGYVIANIKGDYDSRMSYYSALEKHNRTLDITQWLVYFGESILESQQNTIKIIEFLIKKAKF